MLQVTEAEAKTKSDKFNDFLHIIVNKQNRGRKFRITYAYNVV